MKTERMADRDLATQPSFRDLCEAGRLLAQRLQDYAGRADTLVLGLARGGVPVAFEVARALDAPLDVCVVRKLMAPGLDSVTLGAVAAGGSWILDESVIRKHRITDRMLREVAERGFRELREEEETYRGDRPALDIRDCRVILAAEGASTGHILSQAVAALRRHAPAQIVAAVPVTSATARAVVRRGVDKWVALIEPDPFHSIRLAYEDFTRPSLEVVRTLIRSTPLAPARGENRVVSRGNKPAVA